MTEVKTQRDKKVFRNILILAETVLVTSSNLNKLDKDSLAMIERLKDSLDNNMLIEVG